MTILVTGGSGFLGAWIIRRLRAAGVVVRAFDLADDRRLLRLIAGDEVAATMEWMTGDIADAAQVRAAAEGTARIVHLAGLLTPACAADPIRGAQVNLIGTLNVFEAARRERHAAVVYTSTAGVYGPDSGSLPLPQTHYGAFKLACEGSARAYWADHGIASIGFRPYVVYGPGRETGGSAGPSLACRAAVRGEPYTIPYSGRCGLVYVEDVAAAYEAAATREIAGAHVLNMAGVTASTDELIEAIRKVVPGAQLAADGLPLPIAAELDPGKIEAVLPGLPQTPLDEGIARTVAFYRAQAVAPT
jgi:nucleoside-diphosphate-sugar epimerase